MHEMRRFALAVLSGLGLLLLPGAVSAESKAEDAANASDGTAWNAEVAPAKPGAGISLDARQTELVNKVSAYFKSVDTLKGRFVQTGADKKRMRGKFYVSRPGRFRFDYNRPSRQIIVSDGRYMAIQDLDLNNEDRLALNNTPFRLLLVSDVDLVRDANIMEVQESSDLIIVGLEDKNPDNPGQIRLIMATKPELELKEWVTKDAQGLNTRVQVSDLSKSVELDPDLFRIKPVGRPMASP
jgi:outer membrane lipoprotein-sorting protein